MWPIPLYVKWHREIHRKFRPRGGQLIPYRSERGEEDVTDECSDALSCTLITMFLTCRYPCARAFNYVNQQARVVKRCSRGDLRFDFYARDEITIASSRCISYLRWKEWWWWLLSLLLTDITRALFRHRDASWQSFAEEKTLRGK